MSGYTRQSAASIINAATIEAAHLNAEFNAIETAFSGTTGHTHGAGSGDAPKISLTASVSGTLPVANGGTGGATAAAARTALGLAIGTNVQAYDAQLTEIAALALTDGNFIVADGAAWVAESGSTARTSLGLGSIATQAANSVTITGGTISGITDLAIADGGTGASTAADARTNLGLIIGTNVQAFDAQLTDVAGLTPGDGNFIVGDGANFVTESGATARTSLGLGTMATQAASSVTITGGTLDGVTLTNSTIGTGGTLAVDAGGTGATTAAGARTNLGLVIGTNVQAYDAELAALAGVTSAADKVPYFTGSGTASVTTLTTQARDLLDDTTESAMRTTLGLGTIAVQAANNVTITGGAVSGITDIAVADGGTGASTASAARTNLGLVIGTDVQAQGATLTSLEGLSLAQGDILYATAADTLARLPKGTAGQRLAINGGATAPEWVADLWEKINETVASGAAAYTVTGIDAAIDDLMIIFEMIPSTDTTIRLRTYGADGVVDTGGSDYSYTYTELSEFTTAETGAIDFIRPVTDASEAYIVLGPTIESSGTNRGMSATIQMNNIQEARPTQVYGTGVIGQDTATVPVNISGARLENDRITGFTIFLNSGTITGRFSTYGRRGS